MPIETLTFRGQPARRLVLPDAGECTVALHGAQLLSWITPDGVERIYLSPEAIFDGQAAIRGGTPLCWPQFNARGPLAKHGFARNLPWLAEPALEVDREDALGFVLHDSPATQAVWPHGFKLQLRITLTASSLRITLKVHNSGGSAFDFTAALHTYLRVDDLAQARLEGLEGMQCWDALRDHRGTETAHALAFDAEFDRVYAAPARPLLLLQPASALQIAQSASCTETVVWNPGAALSASLKDLPDDGYRHMLCVEAAAIDRPVRLTPGSVWEGWQQLSLPRGA